MSNVPLTYGMNRISRWATIILLTLFVLLTINAVASYFTPAHALKLTELCDQQFSYAAPVDSEGSYGSEYGVDGLNVTPATESYSGMGSTNLAYGVAGYSWQVSGNTFCNGTVINPVTTAFANFLLSMLTSAASNLEGVILLAFSSALTQTVLNETSLLTRFIAAVQSGFWAEWGNAIILVSIGVIAWYFVRRGVKDAAPRMIWTSVAVALLTSFAATTLLSSLATNIQNVRTDFSLAAVNTVMGSDCPSSSDISSQECIANTITSSTLDPVFSYGAAGEMAKMNPEWVVGEDNATGTRDPGSVVYYKADSNMEWDGKKLEQVTLPAAGVVPTTNTDGHPTIAEYLRWTQTNTAAETAAVKNGDITGCSTLNAPAPDELSKKAGDELCYYKWQVRSAVLYSMAGKSASSYSAASGNMVFDYRIQPALMAIPSTGFAINAATFMGAHVIFLNLEFLIQMVALIFVLILVALKASPSPFMDWGGGVAMNTIKVTMLGMMVGALVIILTIVNTIIDKAFNDPLGDLYTLGISGNGFLIVTIMTALVIGVSVIALYVLYFRALRRLKQGNPALAKHDDNSFGAKVRGATNKVLATGGATAATLMSGGTVAAAGFAGLKAGSNASSDPSASMMKSLTSGITQGHRSGSKSAIKQAAKQSAEDKFQQAGVTFEKAMGDMQAANVENNTAEHYQNEANRHEHEAEKADANAETINQQADALEHKSDKFFNDFAAHTPKGKSLQKNVNDAEDALDARAQQTNQKQAALDKFLVDKGATVSHAQVADPKTGNMLTEVTDLSTGATNYLPADQYDPALEKTNIFSPSELDHYNDLSAKRDQAALYESDAQREYTFHQDEYQRHLQNTREDVLGMTNEQIDATYGTQDPQLGKELRSWRAEQLDAQNLRAQANAYTQQASAHRADQRVAETQMKQHANSAQQHLYQARSNLHQADAQATPTTTAQRKMTDYQKGDHLMQNAQEFERQQARAQAAGATQKPVTLVDSQVSTSAPGAISKSVPQVEAPVRRMKENTVPVAPSASNPSIKHYTLK